MGKAHSNKGRFFRFNNMIELDNFVSLYSDLFTPYSKDVVDYESKYYNLGPTMDLIRGFKVVSTGKDIVLRANLTRENLDEILKSKSFTKEKFWRGRSIYVFG